MDMLTDDAPQNQTVAALESSPMEVSDPQDDGQVVAMQAQIQQLVSALSAKTEEAEAAALRAAALEQSLAALKNDFEMVCLHPIFIPYQLQDLLHTVNPPCPLGVPLLPPRHILLPQASALQGVFLVETPPPLFFLLKEVDPRRQVPSVTSQPPLVVLQVPSNCVPNHWAGCWTVRVFVFRVK